MGLKLLFLSWWIPKYIIKREVGHIEALTTDALEALLNKYSSNNINEEKLKKGASEGTIEQRRDAMAFNHTNLVNSLAKVLGKEKAIGLGRDAMFRVGERLGSEACQKLGVGNSLQDLIRAAKILYRVLGIEFEVQLSNPNNAILIVNRCALATKYSELTCQVLSATDEGTMIGLNKKMNMVFSEKITSGQPKCKATITFRKNGGTNY